MRFSEPGVHCDMRMEFSSFANEDSQEIELQALLGIERNKLAQQQRKEGEDVRLQARRGSDSPERKRCVCPAH